MLQLIRKHLSRIIEDIDAGNTNITEEEALKLIEVLKEFNSKDKYLSKYQAYTYLNMSRAKFDNMVREGKIPKGKHIAGFKELFWNKKEIEELIKQK